MFSIKNKSKSTQLNYVNQDCVTIQHEDNYHLLGLLLPYKLIASNYYQSVVKNKPKLQILVLNKYKYTTELEFNYQFSFGESEKITIKLYHDAKVAEIVYCTNVQKFIRLLGPKITPQVHKQTRNMLNSFLNRWLNYLLNNSYSSQLWDKCSEN